MSTQDKRARWLVAAATMLAAVALVAASDLRATATSSAQSVQKPHGKPNVILISTDDERTDSQFAMRRVNRLIGDQGATFSNFYVNYPLCCPSRSTWLTGQYAHNHGVYSNHPPDGGYQALRTSNLMPRWLQQAGYHTIHVGKYLNDYGNSGNPREPKGWNQWYTAMGDEDQSVYDYPLSQNGRKVHHGSRVRDFRQDVYTRKALKAIHPELKSGNPFYLQLDYSAPHAAGPNNMPHPPYDCSHTAKSAPRDVDAFDHAPLPKPPGFNEADVSDKPSFVSSLRSLNHRKIVKLRTSYRCKLESLLSVDRGTAHVINAVKRAGELSNTYILFTSDNGLMRGEHRFLEGKRVVYEPSVRVPFQIRGPRIPQGVTAHDLAINADIAPTILAVTGAKPGRVMDGRSLIGPSRRPNQLTGRELLLESTDFKAIRNGHYKYVEYPDGERELYDLRQDPGELDNLISDPDYPGVEAILAGRLAALKNCAAATCREKPKVGVQVRSANRSPKKSCLRGKLTAAIGGPDGGEVAKSTFIVDRHHIGQASSSPFAITLRSSALGPGKHRIAAKVETADGRIRTVGRLIRVCG